MKWMLTIALLAMASGAYPSDNIVILLDTSGSMDEYMRVAKKTKIEVAQEVLIDVLSNVPPTTKVGLLTFQEWLLPIGPIDQQKLQQAVLSTRPFGGTPLWQFMQAAGTELLKVRERQGNVGSYKIIVITDGEASDGNLAIDREDQVGYLTDIMRRGITVDAIGVAMGADHELATRINGTYMRADDPNALRAAVTKAVAEVGSTGSPDAATEAFQEVASLPDEFALSVIHAITTFENYPIGETAPEVVVAEDGSVGYAEPVPTAENGPSAGEVFLMFVFVLAVALGITLLIVVACN